MPAIFDKVSSKITFVGAQIFHPPQKINKDGDESVG